MQIVRKKKEKDNKALKFIEWLWQELGIWNLDTHYFFA